MLQKFRSCQQLYQTLQGSYKHMELSYEIKMEVLYVIPQDKSLDFFLKGAIIQIWMIWYVKHPPDKVLLPSYSLQTRDGKLVYSEEVPESTFPHSGRS